jgi:bis(5'-nucleosyl)-tetraphosphatase (symmetrical)
MSIYAIGDVQGCFDALQTLLDKIHFDPVQDRLWFTGDLVNRGSRSLEVLRLVKSLQAVAVLGNHDLHLLAVACGQARVAPRDTLGAILSAPDREELLGWLRHRPLFHHDPSLGYAIVHAGLLPQWDLVKANALAGEVEKVLQGTDYPEFLMRMYGDRPNQWRDELHGWGRLRVILNALTRLRYCDSEGRMDLGEKGQPGTQPDHLFPWFEVSTRKSRDANIVFGHWSTLGAWQGNGVVSLDSGCVWGGALTAARLEPGKVEFYHVPCAQLTAGL